MTREVTIANRVREVIRRAPGCTLDELMTHCPEYCREEVCLGVNRLHWEGHLVVSAIGPNAYTFQLWS
jgi:hypothetical protein